MTCQKCKNTKFEPWDFNNTHFEICEKCGSMYQKDSNGEYVLYEIPKIPMTISKPKKQPPTIECPYCKSTNTSKIGVVGRSVSFGLFGFGSSKVGKQWHCNSCKSDF